MNRATILDLLNKHREELLNRFVSRDWTLYLEHRYFALDPAVVWSIVQTKIPALSRAASRVLAEADQGGIPPGGGA